MSIFRLLLYSSLQILAYGAQIALLAAMLSAGQAAVAGKPYPPEALPWLFLNALALIGPLGGVAVQRFYHREAFYLYANHSLNIWLRVVSGTLLIWLLAGLTSLGLQIGDGRIKPEALLQQSQGLSRLASAQALQWMKQNPLIPLLVIAVLLTALLICLLLLISGHEEVLDANEDAEPDFELAIDSVSHAYRNRSVLRGAWLRIRSGEVVGLLGRNGCGKSTLLQILFGTLRADHRALQLNGHALGKAWAVRGLIGYLPQSPFLPPNKRVDKAIRLFAGRQGLARLRQDSRLSSLLKSRVGQLSGGERRFLELGAVLALDRPFVLLDEPFSELEPLYKQRAREWIAAAAARGSGVVVTDHDYVQILKVSRHVVLVQGGSTHPVSDIKELHKVYLPA